MKTILLTLILSISLQAKTATREENLAKVVSKISSPSTSAEEFKVIILTLSSLNMGTKTEAELQSIVDALTAKGVVLP